MTLSIIIVNWNSQAFIRECLQSLFTHCRTVDYEVIVVDSGSFDGCDEMLGREFPTVKYVQSPENVGFARANNLGARQATGDNLLFLNPDTLLIEDSVGLMLAQLRSLPQAGALGCRLLNADRSLQTSCVQAFPTVWNQMLDSEFLRLRYPHWRLWGITALYAQPQISTEVEVVSGACLLCTRESFERVSGFSENYFMYGEDLDLCFKLRRTGFKVYYVPATELVHLGGGSSRQAASNFSTVMMHASVFRFIHTHYGPASALAYRFSSTLTALVRLVLIVPLLFFGNRLVRHGSDSLRKWAAVLRWSLGLEPLPPATGSITQPNLPPGKPVVKPSLSR